MNKSILVIGGAGYIGSHTSYLLASQGYKVIILDNFHHKQSFNHDWATVIKADFADKEVLDDIFENNNIHAIMHFAGLIEVGESVKHPSDFYNNNVSKTLTLLNTLLKYGVKNFIFSSSCAIYGNPVTKAMDETHPKKPISPYGKTKLTIEYILEDYANAYGLKYVSLRYFNAAGSYPEMNLGEQHSPETHIIPLLLKAIANKKPFKVFGNNYDTPDGTCIRDYVHVRDIANAHVKALSHLEKTQTSDFFNLGTGRGFTVRELINAAENICETKADIIEAPRRFGDVDILVADPSKAYNVLDWKPEFSDLEFIIKSALKWNDLSTLLLQHENEEVAGH